MAGRKPLMPAKMRAQASVAVGRHQLRPIAPEVAVIKGEDGWSYGNPYTDSDELGWLALLLESFGTRQVAIANVFIAQLARLCSTTWDGTGWRPDEGEIQTAIAIVRSMAPKNEAQAALAAQAVSIHFTMMRVASNIASRSADARTVAAMAGLGKAFARQLETMQRLQGKRTSRQRITVKNERHIHNHQHIHVDRGGSENGGQAHEPRGTQAGEHEGRASLPRSNPKLVVVPVPRAEGKEALPATRRKIGSV